MSSTFCKIFKQKKQTPGCPGICFALNKSLIVSIHADLVVGDNISIAFYACLSMSQNITDYLLDFCLFCLYPTTCVKYAHSFSAGPGPSLSSKNAFARAA